MLVLKVIKSTAFTISFLVNVDFAFFYELGCVRGGDTGVELG